MQRILITTAALLLALGTARSAADAPKKPDARAAKKPADGIYLVHEKGDGLKVTRNDTGATIVLGERLTDHFRAATMHSMANDNTRFSLHLEGAGPFPAREPLGRAAIMMDGRCFVIWGHSDRGLDGSRDVNTSVHGEDAARAVAKKLGIDANLRKHPGHNFFVTFEPDKKSYQPGAPITLTMKIKNVGEKTVCFHDGGEQRGPRDNQFRFVAMSGAGGGKAVPDTGDPNNFGGKGRYVTLKSGEVFQKTVSLDKWFKFEEADNYRITATYRLEFYDPTDRKVRHVLWNDFATSECRVHVEDGK
ncbi:MAG: hypothetical protein HY289_06030 [Planctomycetes bacterium]|nr:hypothetical protein [Planctomycetota bacterium]